MEFVRTGYGKNAIKVFHIRREGIHHHITELIADVQLTLKTHKDYLTGDNSDIIPTDTIKNTVHALAKLKGVGPLLVWPTFMIFFPKYKWKQTKITL